MLYFVLQSHPDTETFIMLRSGARMRCCFGVGMNRVAHSQIKCTHSQELHDSLWDRWEVLMHTRPLFSSKENKKPGAECIGTVQMGLQGCSLFTRTGTGSHHWVTALPGDLFPPAGLKQHTPPTPQQRPRQQLSMTSGPSKGESGWLLSPCQDVLIMWMLRVRDSTLAWFFYSPSASHTSFSCLQSF